MEQKKQNNNQKDKDFANDIGNMLADFINDTAGFSEEDEIYFRPSQEKRSVK